jgi:hypothetical protein
MAVVTLVLTGIGAVSLLIRDRKIGLLVIFPFVVTVIASALQRYPLKNRFILFLVPFALLLMAEGFRGIYWLVSKWKANFAGVFSAALALAVVWLIAPITYEKVVSKVQDDIRPVFAYVAGNKQPDDIIYVFHATDPAFHYYAPFYGLDTSTVIVGVFGPGKRITLKNYHEDIVKLVGNGRVWFIFSEILDCAGCVGEGTQADYLEEINRFGIMLDSFDGSGGNAYLYNLKP